jgi:NADH dehydrogenase FAD-containing subunit
MKRIVVVGGGFARLWRIKELLSKGVSGPLGMTVRCALKGN